jgi:medium-chain acyl-[acyl-carrier-protein] hydrolase
MIRAGRRDVSSHPPQIVRTTNNPWVSRSRPSRSATVRVFCLPYAGGGASMYRTWATRLPETIEVCPIQLPGREARFRDRPFTRMGPLVEALQENLRALFDLPFAFFGHSMGALIGFELSRGLERSGLRPACLFVSGCRPPHSAFLDPAIHGLPDDEFLDHLSRRYRAIPDAVRQNAELTELVLPALRADFELLGSYVYVYAEGVPLACPIAAYGGDRDDTVAADDLAGWAEYTSGGFGRRVFAGDHFYLRTAEADVLNAMAEQLAAG